MDWGTFKDYLVERVKFDFNVPFDVSDASQKAIGTTFDTRVAQHLALFTRDTFVLFGHRLALTLTSLDGNDVVSLRSAAAKPVFEPVRLWVNGTEVVHERADKVIGSHPATVQQSTPTRFGLLGPYKVVFNTKLTSADAAAGGYVDGFYTHPAPTADGEALEIDDEHAEAATMYSAGLLMEASVTGEEAGKRLSYYKSRARSEMRRIRAEMTERYSRSY